ncbi:GNAT family N-acetyltransferase [Nonomuraea cavernae]|uniref:N-acetyltransferase domain-containing protein n=1 Tax=Nonomuraea cavernae TaxID=2045107 RepID=A0A917YYX6_9ACTN|nr:GNAT family N-acetyltransferase [Nonomuraea cavernae]MCA2186159.1 GNAT family N-acetyltransferase [Nonomuraea cavernae]GGO70032.1 hypothetical protein GCM10012289_32530 [Nonomuraea cavernae]
MSTKLGAIHLDPSRQKFQALPRGLARTWRGRLFAHLDCLYVVESHRGAGLGGSLMERIVDLARTLDADELQWQTPHWNSQAIGFYDRLGGTSTVKHRYRLWV